MQIKIYFNEKPLFLCDGITGLEPLVHDAGTVFIDEFSQPAVRSMIHEMQSEKVQAGIFYDADLDKIKKAFWKKFTVLQAGGGLVRNEQNGTLFIFRRGKWDLPKGKLDEGESLEQCALREVQEETGLRRLELKRFILATYHTYSENGKPVLKESYWYEMRTDGGQELVPQIQEDIFEARWVEKEGMDEILSNTFPSIKDVVQAG